MPQFINVKGRLISLDQPQVMGILNVTPDSFYAGSRVEKIDLILKKANQMVDEGAGFLDIGGYSSRPGAEDISVKEEINRISDPLREVKKAFPETVVSIDTFRTPVAEAAIALGADMVNDISGGHLDRKMYDFIAANRVPYIAMHMKGTPQNMSKKNHYENLIQDIIYYFSQVMEEMTSRGATDLILDPGFGFGKNIDQNFELLNGLDLLQILEKPILVGLSRKSMIYKTLKTEPYRALNGTTALNALALYKGASMLRVHDVAPALETIRLIKRMI